MQYVCLLFLVATPLSLVVSAAADVANSSHEFQKIDSFELVYNPCSSVRRAGFVCVDCATLGYCMNIDNQWQTIEMTSCKTDAGFYCNDEGAIGCTWRLQCNVPVRGKFYCQLPGIYPDPYDCRNYHVCSQLNEDTPQRCQNGYAYSTLTQSCSMPNYSETCTEKQYECESVGQMGAWKSNATLYYVCQKEVQGDMEIYYPLMMQCQPNYIFNGRMCVSQQQQKQQQQQQQQQQKQQPQHLNKLQMLQRYRAASLGPLKSNVACHDYTGIVNPSDCSLFTVCIDGNWELEAECPKGTCFNEDIGVCA